MPPTAFPPGVAPDNPAEMPRPDDLTIAKTAVTETSLPHPVLTRDPIRPETQVLPISRLARAELLEVGPQKRVPRAGPSLPAKPLAADPGPNPPDPALAPRADPGPSPGALLLHPVALAPPHDPRPLVAPPPHVAPVLAQLAQAAAAVRPGMTELRLSPEELGAVRIDLRTEGDQAILTLSAERPDTLDLMRRHADRLVSDLRAAGFQQLDLSFGRWAGQGQPQGGQPGQAMAPPADAPPAPRAADPPLAPSRPPIGGANSLYLRI